MDYIYISYANDINRNVEQTIVAIHATNGDYIRDIAERALDKVAKVKNIERSKLSILDYKYFGQNIDFYID